MDDCTFKTRIVVKPSTHEFWPATGWHIARNGWQRLYACCDRKIVRRAVVESRPGRGWTFRVSEVTQFGTLAVAIQPLSETATEPTQCLHAADNCACGTIKEARLA